MLRARAGKAKSSPVKDLPTRYDHLQGDCVAAMNDRARCVSVDLVFADPPYNLQLRGRVCTGPNNSLVDAVDDALGPVRQSFAAYDALQPGLAGRGEAGPEARRRDLGDRQLPQHLPASAPALQDLGYWILNDVIWRKTNPMPNFRGRRFTNAHETLIWAAKDDRARHTFNYDAMKNAERRAADALRLADCRSAPGTNG